MIAQLSRPETENVKVNWLARPRIEDGCNIVIVQGYAD